MGRKDQELRAIVLELEGASVFNVRVVAFKAMDVLINRIEHMQARIEHLEGRAD